MPMLMCDGLIVIIFNELNNIFKISNLANIGRYNLERQKLSGGPQYF